MIVAQKKVQTTSADWACLDDEAADPIERVFALKRLRRLGHTDKLVPKAEEWLNHSNPHLRCEALTFLMIFRANARYLAPALAILHGDPSWWVRVSAARDLIGRQILTDDTRDEILRHLVAQLEADEDEDTQMGIYGVLLEALIPNRADRPKLPGDAREWERARDVDWQLLAPWRTPPA